MDTFALGLKATALLLEEGSIERLLQERYSSFSKGVGKEIVDGTASFKSLESYILDRKDISPEPSNQEYLERLVNWAIANAAR